MFTKVRKISQKKMLVYVVSTLFILSLFLPVQFVMAGSGLEIYTRYPGISAAAGESIVFPLEIKNNTAISQTVNLKITSLPEGWTASIRGQGREIQQVFVEANNSGTADLKIKIPEETAAGRYSIGLETVSDKGYRDNFKLAILISEARMGGDELNAQYSELKGPSDATFNFQMNLTNNGSSEQTYSLGAQAPDGWQVTFTPSYESQQVASINVKPGETKGLDVKVMPALSAEAGEYTVVVRAVSAASQVAEKVKVIISGTYKLEFTTPSGRMNGEVVAGKDTKINLILKNAGGALLNDINFSSHQPPDWAVSFEPEKIESLKPGETRQITATITADSKAISGDYLVSLSAATRETRSTADLRVTVKTSTLWGLVGVVIVLLVIAGVYKVFQTYGRR